MAFGLDDIAIAYIMAQGGLGGAGAAGLGAAGAAGLGANAGGLNLGAVPNNVGTALTRGTAGGGGSAVKITAKEGGIGNALTQKSASATSRNPWGDAALVFAQLSQGNRPPSAPAPQSFSGLGQPAPPRSQGPIFAPSPQQQRPPVPGLGQFLA